MRPTFWRDPLPSLVVSSPSGGGDLLPRISGIDVNRVTSLGHCHWIGFVARADSWLAEAFAGRHAGMQDRSYDADACLARLRIPLPARSGIHSVLTDDRGLHRVRARTLLFCLKRAANKRTGASLLAASLSLNKKRTVKRMIFYQMRLSHRTP